MKIPYFSDEFAKLERKLESLTKENSKTKSSTQRALVSTKLTESSAQSGGSYFDNKNKNKGEGRVNMSLRNSYYAYPEASQDLLFHNNYLTVKSLVFAQEIEVIGKFKSGVNWYEQISQYMKLESLGKDIFTELYSGVGIGLIYFYENKFNFTPYYVGKNKMFEFKNGNFLIKQNSMSIDLLYNLSIPESDCLIVNESMRQSLDNHNSRSVLGRVIDMIDLKLRAIEAQKRLASKDYQSDKLLSPNYGKFPRPSDNNALAEVVNEVSANMNEIVEDLNAVNNTSGTFALATPFDVTKISQTNAEIQIIQLLNYIDEQIYLGCGLNGTFLNTDSSNKASAEQGMDNVRDTVILHYQQVISECLSWCLEKVDSSFAIKGYKVGFKKNENDETLKIRDQALVVLKDVLPNISGLGYKVTDESIQKVLNSFDLVLDLSTPEPILAPSPIPPTSSPAPIIRKLEPNIPTTSFSNIEESERYVNIKSKVKEALANQYDDFLDSNKRIKVGDRDYPDLENYLSKDELIAYANEVRDLAIEDYQNEYKKEIKDKQNFKKKIEAKVKESLRGDGDNYLGTSSTTAKQLQSESDKLLSGKSDSDIQSYFESRKEYFIENGFKRLEDGLFAYLYYDLTSDIALGEGDDGVGEITVLDKNVRPPHKLNHARCWRNGNKSPGGLVAPWKDFGCRCSYSFQSIKQLVKQGFTQ
jgi:hypothetical protein